MRYVRSGAALVAAAILFLAVSAHAVAPLTINYQGVLQDDAGNPLDTTVSMEFAIYDDSTGGNLKWSETIEDVEVVGGLFNVILGTDGGITDTAFHAADRYLGITVGDDSETTPRTAFTSVPYAYSCLGADSAAYALTGPFVNGTGEAGYIPVLTDAATITNSVLYQTGGKLGVNTTSASAALHVAGGSSTVPVFKVETVNSVDFDPGAPVIIKGGYGGTGAAGGDVTIAGGQGSSFMGTGAYGGGVTILGGDAGGTPSPGGDVHICGGVGYGIITPAHGDVILAMNDESYARGNVGIRKEWPSYELDVNGDIGCVEVHESSDRRLKQDIQTLAGVLDRLDHIEAVSYEWNSEAVARGATAGARTIGVVAQDLEAEFPSLVATADDGYKSVSYGKFTGVLLAAVKELRAESDQFKTEIAELRALIEQLQANQR